MPRQKDHAVPPSAGDRMKLSRVVPRGMRPARMISWARILLELDKAVGPVSDRRVVTERAEFSEGNVNLVAKRFTECADRADDVIGRRKRAAPPVEPKVTDRSRRG